MKNYLYNRFGHLRYWPLWAKVVLAGWLAFWVYRLVVDIRAL